MIAIGISVLLLTWCKKTTVQQNPVEDDAQVWVQEQDVDSGDDEEAHNEDAGDTEAFDGKRYLIPQAIVTYTVWGSMQSGKETLTFDNYGARERRETETEISVSGFKSTNHTVMVLDKGEMISYNVQTRTGIRIPQTEMANELEDAADARGMNATEFWMEMLENMGGVKEWTKTVAGKQCDIRKIEQLGTTVCLREGIVLEQTVSVAWQTQEQTATSIVTNGIDEASFEVPADITITDMGDMPSGIPNM